MSLALKKLLRMSDSFRITYLSVHFFHFSL